MPIEEVREIFEKLKNVLGETYKENVDYVFFNKYIAKLNTIGDTIEEQEDLELVEKIMEKNGLTEGMIDKIVRSINLVELDQRIGVGNFETSLEEMLNPDVEIKDGMVIMPLENEVEEELEEIEEEPNQPKLSPKAKKLEEKVNILIEKIENEKNPFKKHILQFKVKMLITKIQREIDIVKIKEEFKAQRIEKKREKMDREDENVENIGDLTSQIEELEGILATNARYDYASSKFIYPKDYIEKKGGIEKFKEQLESKKDQQSSQIANKIEAVAEVRQELEKLEQQLQEKQQQLSESDKIYNEDIKKINKEERSLIRTQKMDIFTKIGTWFKNLTGQIKEFFAERKENKELKTQQAADINKVENEENEKASEIEKRQKEEEQKIIDKYNQMLEKIQAEMDAALAEHQEKSDTENEQIKMQRETRLSQQKDVLSMQAEEREEGKRHEVAENFRMQMANMMNFSQETGTTGNGEQAGQQGTQVNEKDEEVK